MNAILFARIHVSHPKVGKKASIFTNLEVYQKYFRIFPQAYSINNASNARYPLQRGALKKQGGYNTKLYLMARLRSLGV